ncbi:MAG: Alpha-methylacyl-CoA racemase [Candidatus Aminicenantes bacterium]|nr:Alpha-methylacyl-CoA racemase [Candidatus Aminicenantes bacterium]
MGPFVGGESSYFLALNPGKKSVSLNLKAPGGREIFMKLAATARVIVESFRPGTVERLGIGYDAVRAVNPGIVYCAISGYGQDGPDRDLAGHDLDFTARSGILGLCGRPGELPAIPPVQIADLGSALFAATGILAWLGMLDSAVAMMVMPAAEHEAGERGGRGRMPLSGKHPCYNVYRTRDGRDVSLAALEKKFWESFCRKVGRDDLVPLQFSEKAEDLALFEALFAGRTAAEWREILAGTDFCCEVVSSLDEVFEDPQVRARNLVIPPAPGGPAVRRVGHPLRSRAEHGRKPCPGHGEHTAELLREIGISEAEIDGLEASGVIRRGR